MDDLNDQQHAAVTVGITASGLPEEFGGYNSMPPNWEEITESEFLWRFGQHQKQMHFRQVKHLSVPFGMTKEESTYKENAEYLREVYCNVYFWTFPDWSGVGLIQHYNGAATRSELDAYFAQWFKFYLCAHEFETTVNRMCLWEGTCKKCGYHKVVDSSG